MTRPALHECASARMMAAASTRSAERRSMPGHALTLLPLTIWMLENS